jgi:glycine/D-amino acid oxidase-like deaminating enzyme
LIASISKRGGVLEADADVADIDLTGNKVSGVVLRNGKRLSAGAVVIAAGAWSGQFPSLNDLAPACAKVQPVRGQLLCYKTDPKLVTRLLTCSRHYVVHRERPRGTRAVRARAAAGIEGIETGSFLGRAAAGIEGPTSAAGTSSRRERPVRRLRTLSRRNRHGAGDGSPAAGHHPRSQADDLD